MTLDAHRRETLLQTVRAPDFRRALHAIAELRADDGPGLADVVAGANDAAALAALEVLRGESGEPHHVSYERLDEGTLSWAVRLVAARRGIAPEILLTARRRLQGLSLE